MLPSLFVMLSLLALLVGPFLIQARARALTAEIQDAADPARTAVTRIQYLLARQTAALRGYLISGDESYLDQYEDLAGQEQQAYELLYPLAGRLGTEVVARLARLRAMSEGWHSDIEEDLRVARGDLRTAAEMPFDRDAYLATLEAAGQFDEAVVGATLDRQQRIRAAEDRMVVAQVGLVALALLAAAVTAWLGAKVRRSAHAAEARRLEAERALAETARAVEAKARLIRGVTHDVKNPLGAADGYAELLEMGVRGALSPEQARMVVGIRRSIESGLRIISDMLELAGAESESLPIHPSVFPLDSLLRDCADDYRGAASAAGHRLELTLPTEPVMVRADPARVKQILGNLLSNAVKYTPEGGTIRLDLECGETGAAADIVLVHVRDDGRGIPPEYQERIFDEFERLPGSGAGGHGLGLAIARRIARLLGGDLYVRSDGERGSTFTLILPGLPEAEGPRTG